MDLNYLSITDLIIPDRQRKEISPSHIKSLKTSILTKGLLHPLVLRGDGRTLVAGKCRSKALIELHQDGHQFFCNGKVVPADKLPFVHLSADLPPDMIAEAELEENIFRLGLPWEDENEAIVLIHKLRATHNPSQTLSDTARELAEKSGKSVQVELHRTSRALIISEHKDDPRVKAAKSSNEAYRAVLDKQAAGLRQHLHTRGLIPTDHDIHLGDCREILPKLEAGICDTILTDPPYGINADNMKKSAKHFYKDDVDHALDVTKTIIREGFRLLKPRGVAFIFCDVEHFKELRDYAQAQGFTPWRTPVIWRKGIEGQAPWGVLGFTRTYEVFLYLSKGQKGTTSSSPDVKDYRRPARSSRVHAAEKPVELLGHLLSLAGDPGDVVLDPCCGSGPVIEACTQAKMKCIAIEIDKDYHALAISRLDPSSEFNQELQGPQADAATTPAASNSELLS